MITTRTNRQEWIESLCERFSLASGWPMVFTQSTEEPDSSRETDLEIPWSMEVNDGQQCLGHLSLNLPVDSKQDRAFAAVRELAELYGDLINRLTCSKQSLDARNKEVSTLVDIGRSHVSDQDLLSALTQLLRAAVQLTGFRAAGFFLLNPSSSGLTLRVIHHLEPREIPHGRRDLTENPPDLDALTRGSVLIERGGDRDKWLPESSAMAMCVSVHSGDGPIGTLWAFDRRMRRPSDRETHVLESIAAQIASLLERTVLRRESESQHRMQKHLTIASEIQRSDVLEELPADVQFDAAGVCSSRYELGGDLCELIPIDQHNTVIAVGDASGDSVPAAMVMSAVRGALRSLTVDPLDRLIRTEQVMQRINRALYSITPSYQFMSMLYGVLNTDQRTFTYTNAGHPAPIFLCGENIEHLRSHGMLLGVQESSSYEHSVVDLAVDDMLVFFSDGITEAMSSGRQMFRSEGVIGALRGQSSSSAEEVMQTIWSQLEQHMQDGCDPDDRTLLVIRIR